VGEGAGYGHLGTAYDSTGDFSQAMEYHGQDLAIAKEVGDRAGDGRAYGNLCTCHTLCLNDFDKAVAYHKARHAVATSPKVAHMPHMQFHAALCVALALYVQAARQDTATGADQAPGRQY
jgi:hypothetical protein